MALTKSERSKRARASKSKGKRGEANAKALLELKGWLMADKETQGLAGDDLFGCDPDGTYFSIEVKNTVLPDHHWLQQAENQGRWREAAITEALKDERSLASRLGITFDKNNWFVMWHPSGWGCPADLWVIFRKKGRFLGIEVW